MDPKSLQVLPLHKHPQYLKACCDLINEEWPRSETARMISLTASCDELPTSLILVNSGNHLLGHCKLTPIPSIPESCFVETVVISKSMRGQRLGTHLMKCVEEYCKEILRLKMIHLSTKGQENFYAKLGYTICAPVSIYGVRLSSNKPAPVPAQVIHTESIETQPQVGSAPPPPPMPSNVLNSNSTMKTSKTYMSKYL